LLDPVLEKVQKILFNGFVQIEGRVQSLDYGFQVQQYLSQDIDVHGQAHIVFGGNTVQLDQQPAHLHIPIGAIGTVYHQGPNLPFKVDQVAVFLCFTDGKKRGCHAMGIPIGQAEEQLDEVVSHVFGEPCDHSQIDERNLVVPG